ncbi:hypothetical protein [Catellatospora citrea]|uniref:Uncharacterized protein n=1 Tax=Catellatospora citrea TaxID=53366 RepID=A0A8J3KIZ9_9ACTN|nr:hypothetical protein [Catellatospora citrea]RKE11376.1 hypothetical protein C8E86_6301 [Catellatospora citrea]GIF96844.1 hypothetical protein Cci01nite_19380 [Catellatospora citrea]
MSRVRHMVVVGLVAALAGAGWQVAVREVRPSRPPQACGLLRPELLELALGSGYGVKESHDGLWYGPLAEALSACVWDSGAGRPWLRLIVRHYGWAGGRGPLAHVRDHTGDPDDLPSVYAEALGRYYDENIVDGQAVEVVSAAGAYSVTVAYISAEPRRTLGVARLVLVEAMSGLKG